MSGTPQVQFEEANAPAVSGDGRYVVFRGSLAGVPGIYRRDLQTGSVEEVAGGDAGAGEPCSTAQHPLAACDAGAPSVSANGQYVAFTTSADLQPQRGGVTSEGEPSGDAGCPEVYVRDMGTPEEPLPADSPHAYTLASELDESSVGITYSGCGGGAQAASAVAMSADGAQVVFTVLGTSNLMRGPGCEAKLQLAECPAETPPSQVAVRDLATHTTTLVTATPTGQATPGGGAYPSAASESRPPGDPEPFGEEPAESSAAISADGSTVAWLGTNVPLQVPSAGEIGERGYHGPNEDPLSHEAEPLWRRIADGSGAVTERLLANAGLDLFFAFGQGGPTGMRVLDGSFSGVEGALFIPPALSADGRTVALIADAPNAGAEESFQIYSREAWPNSDAYVVRIGEGDMPQVTPLTVTANYAAELAATAPIDNIAISPEGTRVAFDTARTQFNSPGLALISPNVTYTGVREVYEANIAHGTLQRVTSAYEGGRLRGSRISAPPPREGSTGLISFSADGQTLAFDSTATNLFYGDGVPASEVYLTHEIPSSEVIAPQEVGPQSGPPPPPLEWTLNATAHALADGSVVVEAQAPGAGTLSVSAGAQLPASTASPPAAGAAPRRRSARGHKAAGANAKAARTDRARKDKTPKRSETPKRSARTEALPVRTVARGESQMVEAGKIELQLHVTSRYGALVASKHGLYTVLRIAFAAPAHHTLTDQLPVTFHAISRKRVKR